MLGYGVGFLDLLSSLGSLDVALMAFCESSTLKIWLLSGSLIYESLPAIRFLAIILESLRIELSAFGDVLKS